MPHPGLSIQFCLVQLSSTVSKKKKISNIIVSSSYSAFSGPLFPFCCFSCSSRCSTRANVLRHRQWVFTGVCPISSVFVHCLIRYINRLGSIHTLDTLSVHCRLNKISSYPHCCSCSDRASVFFFRQRCK